MEKEKDVLCLRPHHGMCLAYFEGKGYSGAFAKHMGQVLERLMSEGGSEPVRLTVSGDEICSACPNLTGGICRVAGKVEAYDRAVLELCGLSVGGELPFREFARQVQTAVLEVPGRREAVCGDCQWNVICGRKKSRWTEG